MVWSENEISATSCHQMRSNSLKTLLVAKAALPHITGAIHVAEVVAGLWQALSATVTNWRRRIILHPRRSRPDS